MREYRIWTKIAHSDRQPVTVESRLLSQQQFGTGENAHAKNCKGINTI